KLKPPYDQSKTVGSGGSCWGLAALARRLHSPDLWNFSIATALSNDGTDSGVTLHAAATRGGRLTAPGADEISLSSSDRDSEDSGSRLCQTITRMWPALRGETAGGIGVPPDRQIRSRLLYSLLCVGRSGNEEFYLTFFPYWFWNVDGYAGRRVLIVWAASMYVGQALKEIMQIPRPASPPVAKQRSATSWSTGSRLLNATIGVAIPFALFSHQERTVQERYLPGLAVCICWSMLVCLSRIYLGMHSFLDVIAGALLGVIFLVVLYPYLDRLDRLADHRQHWLGPALAPDPAVPGLPVMQRWNTARGDSTTILAGLCGIYVGAWLAYQHNMYDRPKLPPPYQVKFRQTGVLRHFSRCGWPWRHPAHGYFALSKFAFYRVSGPATVELPYKFATYTLVSFSVTYVIAAVLFRGIGIHRIVEFTDLDPD
uniref:AcidPPc domain-containing protein n=1 Tax=Macrostomum lignano TaxID=282301 RepID=A0A1I8F3S5_9PLAT